MQNMFEKAQRVENLLQMKQTELNDKEGILSDVLNSRSWKLTYPLRKLCSYLK